MNQIWLKPRYGSAGFIVNGWWFHLKAPWCAPLFSERHGLSEYRQLGFGWRYAFRKVRDYSGGNA